MDEREGLEPLRQLTIYIRETDRVEQRPLYLRILELVRERDGAGATVLRGVAGYSSSSHTISTSAFADIRQRLPLVIQIVDSAAWVEAVLPELHALIEPNGGMLTVQELAGHHYSHPNLGGE